VKEADMTSKGVIEIKKLQAAKMSEPDDDEDAA